MNDHSKKKEFLQNYQKTFGQVGQCCLAMKISVKVLNSWIKNDESFRDDINTLDRTFIDIMETAVLKKIKEGDDKWIWRWLTCRAPDRWHESNSMSMAAIAQGGAAAVRFEISDNIIKTDEIGKKPEIETKPKDEYADA